MKRVVITGMGVISPIGNNVEEFWSSVRAGKVGIGPITRFDTADYKVKLAAEVQNFDPKDFMDGKAAKRMELFSQYAVAAAAEALEDAGIRMEQEDPFRVGVCIGSGTGSLQTMEREYQKLLNRGPGRVGPLLVPMMIANMAAGNVAIRYGCKGKCIDVTTACATGTHSVGEAYRSIQHGEADVMLAGGTEAAICPLGIAGFTALTALSQAEDPLRASLPFDRDRSGFVMGEGAGVLILESLEHAAARNARIYGEVKGYGATCDAYHITSPAEDGMGAAMAMKYAMEEAGWRPADVDYINAHGTGTHHNDLFETRAVKQAFGDQAGKVKISSTKSMIGHLLGAAGAVELIVCVKSIQEGWIHPTVGLTVPGEECDLDYVPGHGVFAKVERVLSNSLGFGGHNAAVAVGRFQE